jgi:uncharacterized UBP type Zn finger protein
MAASTKTSRKNNNCENYDKYFPRKGDVADHTKKHKVWSGKGFRIRNGGNSCFLISAINALLASDIFQKALLDSAREAQLKVGKGEVFKSIKNIASSTPDTLNCVKDIRTKVAEHHLKNDNSDDFDDGTEHDAVDFLRALLKCLKSEFRPEFNWIEDLTKYVIQKKFTCHYCDHESVADNDEDNDLVLRVYPVNAYSISSVDDAVKAELETELMAKPHSCKNPDNEDFIVTKQMTVIPKVLMIQVMRFEYSQKYKRYAKSAKKITPHVRMKIKHISLSLDASINTMGAGLTSGHCITNVHQGDELFTQCNDKNLQANLTADRANLDDTCFALYSQEEGGQNRKTESEPADFSMDFWKKMKITLVDKSRDVWKSEYISTASPN